MNSICGAQCKSTGKPCQNIAGKGTDHVGEGRCRHHGGATPIQHGLYSKIRRARLGKRMADIAGRSDLLRLDQEVAMMKVLLEQLLERDQSRVAALHAWHLTTSGAFKTLVETNDASQIRDALLALRAAEPLRPAELPDLVIVATLVEKIRPYRGTHSQNGERLYPGPTPADLGSDGGCGRQTCHR